MEPNENINEIDLNTADMSIYWEILKLEITPPVFIESPLQYNKKNQSVIPNDYEYDPELVSITNYYKQNGNYVRTTNTRAIGEYKTVVSLIEPNNTEWLDGSTNDITYEWEIEGVRVQLPILDQSEFTFNTQLRTVNIVDFDPEWVEIVAKVNDETGTATLTDLFDSATHAGQYYIEFKLLDPLGSLWESGDTNNYRLEWQISGLGIGLPPILKNQLYTGSVIYAKTKEFDPVYISVTGTLEAIRPGDYNLYFSLNYPNDTYWIPMNHSNSILSTWSIIKIAAGMLLYDLNTGKKIIDNTGEVPEEKILPYIWRVEGNGHSQDPTNSIILTYIPALYDYTLNDGTVISQYNQFMNPTNELNVIFDDKEPENTNINIQNHGWNRYRYSNVLQWLNSEELNYEWYNPTHEYDNLNSEELAYYDNKTMTNGFLNAFSEELSERLLTVNKNTVYYDENDIPHIETVSSKVFLESAKEVGINCPQTNEYSGIYDNEGETYEFYKSGITSSRISGRLSTPTYSSTSTSPDGRKYYRTINDSSYNYVLRTAPLPNTSGTSIYSRTYEFLMRISFATADVSSTKSRRVNLEYIDSNTLLPIQQSSYSNGRTTRQLYPNSAYESTLVYPCIALDLNSFSIVLDSNNTFEEGGQIYAFNMVSSTFNNTGFWGLTYTTNNMYRITFDDSSGLDSPAFVNIHDTLGTYKIMIPSSEGLSMTYTGSLITLTIPEAMTQLVSMTGETIGVEVGSYTAMFTIKDPTTYTWTDNTTETKSVTWYITPKGVMIPTIEKGLLYTGELQQPTIYNLDSTMINVLGDLSGTQVRDNYSITFSLKDSHTTQWIDGSVEDKIVTWDIIKRYITFPSISETFTYDKSEHTVIIDGYESDFIDTLSSSVTSAIVVGEYNIIFSLKDKVNTIWEDESITDVEYTWSIVKRDITIPTTSGTYTYTGSTRTVTVNDFDEDYVDQIGDITGINAGEYIAVFSLKDRENTQWTDGSTTAKQSTWTIDKKTITIPTVNGDFYYDGSEKEAVITGMDEGYVEITNDSETRATTSGNHFIRFELKDSSNTQWDDETITIKQAYWTIGAAMVDIPEVSGEFIYDGTSKSAEITGYDSTYMNRTGTISSTNAGEFTITFSLKSTTDISWSDGSTGDKRGTWKISPQSVTIPTVTGDYTFDGTEKQASITGYDENLMIRNGTIKTELAGSYDVLFTLLSTVNYKWSDDTLTVKKFTWVINKLSITSPTISGNLEYNGSEQSPSISSYNTTYIEISGDKETEVGNYTATASLIDPANTEWSDHTTVNKTFPWNIEPIIVTIPTISGTYTFDKTQKNASITGFDDSIMKYSTTSVFSAMNTGVYTIEIELKDNANYKWSDNTTSIKTFTWEIEAIEINLPSISTPYPIYDGTTQSPAMTYDTNYVSVSGDSGINAGDYTAIFSLIDSTNTKWSDDSITDKQINWSIQKLSVDVPNMTINEFTYDGTTIYSPTVIYDSTHSTQSGTNSSLSAGEFELIYALNDTNNYKWSTGGSNNKVYTWRVNKLNITVPTVSGEFTYNGSEKEANITGFDSNTMTVINNKATNAGIYTPSFTLTDSANTKWSTSNNATVTNGTWEIKKATIDKPTISNIEFTYDGNTHSPTITGYSSTYMSYGNPYDDQKINVGDYTITIQIKESIISNYQWSDNTNSAIIFNWSIVPAEVTAPSVASEVDYTGEPITPVISNIDNTLVNTFCTSQINPGDYSITFSLKDKNNYIWSTGGTTDIVLNWSIIAKIIEIAIPTVSPLSFEYDGTVKEPVISSYSSYHITQTGITSATNAGDYEITFSLVNTMFMKWSDDTIADKVISWKIEKVVLGIPTVSGDYEYDTSSHDAQVSGYDDNTMTRSGTVTNTNVGDYTLTFNLKDSNNYKWSDGSATSKTGTWKITKKLLTIPSVSGTYTYDGTEKSATITNYDSTTMNQSGTESTTNTGTYTITFSLKSTDNYKWSDNTTSNKVINWVVDPMQVTPPEVVLNAGVINEDSTSFKHYYTSSTGEPYDWDGQVHQPVTNINNIDTNYVTITGNFDTSNVGSYDASFVLKDTTNTIWDNSSSGYNVGGTAKTIEFYWEIILPQQMITDMTLTLSSDDTFSDKTTEEITELVNLNLKLQTEPNNNAPQWSTGTDEEIVRMVELADAGYIDLGDYWNVGDERIQPSNVYKKNNNYYTYIYILLQEGLYLLNESVRGKNGTTRNTVNFIVGIALKNGYGGGSVAARLGSSYWGTTSTWESSHIRIALNNNGSGTSFIMYSNISSIFKKFKTVSATDYNSTTTTTTVDLFALPAEKEIFGKSYYGNPYEANVLEQFEYYKDKTVSYGTRPAIFKSSVPCFTSLRSLGYNVSNRECILSTESAYWIPGVSNQSMELDSSFVIGCI